MPIDQQGGPIVVQLSIFNPYGVLCFQRDAIPREEAEMNGALERRLQDVLFQAPSMHALCPLVFVLGTFYSYFAPIGDHLGGVAITCHWDPAMEQHQPICQQFVLRLAWILMFFLGSERKIFFKQLRQKGALIEMIADMSIKGRRLNFDALSADFIRRATPPSLSHLCVPANTDLKVIVREHWQNDASKGDLQRLVGISINNPISNELQGTLGDSRVNINPIITMDPRDRLVFPLGLYPLTVIRSRQDGSPVDVHLGGPENDDRIIFRITNRSEVSIKDGIVAIQLFDSILSQ